MDEKRNFIDAIEALPIEERLMPFVEDMSLLNDTLRLARLGLWADEYRKVIAGALEFTISEDPANYTAVEKEALMEMPK